MPYSKEASDIPQVIFIRPTWDNNGNIVAVPCAFNFIRRVKNDADPNDQLPPIQTATVNVDLYDNVKTVNIPGIGVVPYRKLAQGLKLVADAERGA